MQIVSGEAERNARLHMHLMNSGEALTKQLAKEGEVVGAVLGAGVEMHCFLGGGTRYLGG